MHRKRNKNKFPNLNWSTYTLSYNVFCIKLLRKERTSLAVGDQILDKKNRQHFCTAPFNIASTGECYTSDCRIVLWNSAYFAGFSHSQDFLFFFRNICCHVLTCLYIANKQCDRGGASANRNVKGSIRVVSWNIHHHVSIQYIWHPYYLKNVVYSGIHALLANLILIHAPYYRLVETR